MVMIYHDSDSTVIVVTLFYAIFNHGTSMQ